MSYHEFFLSRLFFVIIIISITSNEESDTHIDDNPEARTQKQWSMIMIKRRHEEKERNQEHDNSK